MSDERDIARLLRDTPVPEDAAERRDRVVGRAMGARARRRARRRTAGLGALACLVVAGGAFSVNQALDHGSILPGGGEGAATTGSGVTDLGALPWVSQPEGARTVDDVPAGTGAVEFPAGTTHAQAADALYLAVTRRGALPVAARPVAPLPRGVVLMRMRDGALRLSLAAPFGYDPDDGRVTLPSLAVSPGGAARVDLAPLPACQVRTEGRPGPDCPFVAP